jgi:hypothetical protein
VAIPQRLYKEKISHRTEIEKFVVPLNTEKTEIRQNKPS